MSNWMILVAAAIVFVLVFTFVLQSLVAAAVATLILGLAAGGLSSAFGDFDPFEWLSKPVTKTRDGLQQLGCGENKDSIVFGDADRCKTYKIALKKCKERTTKESRQRCQQKAEDKFNKSVITD